MNAHYLVTGGCGFIGSHITEALVAAGHEVTVFDNLSTGKLENIRSFHPKIHFTRGDIRDADALMAAMKGVTHVFHEAALVSVFLSVEQPELNHEINGTGLLNVLRAARAQGVKRVVLASSSAVYGNNPALPKTETMIPEPASPYAAEKMFGEYMLQVYSALYGIEAVALRYFNVYGPRQDPSSPYSGVISIFARAIQKGVSPTIYGDGLQTRDFVYIQDVVRANLLAMHAENAGHGEAFNIGTGHITSLLDLVNTISEICHTTVQPIMEPTRAGDVRHSLADISKARRTLNYTPQFSLKEGLEALLAHTPPT